MNFKAGILSSLTGTAAVHTYYWTIFTLAIFVPIQYFMPPAFALRVAAGTVLPLIPAVYIHFFLLENYFNNRQYFKYALYAVILLVLIGTAAQYFIDYLVPEVDGGIKSFLNPAILVIITSGSRYYTRGLKLQAQLLEAQAKQYKAELDLLKYQVNPHFFFNTLNNLFAMARRQKDQSTAKGIAKLSHLMRYMIYDCNVDKIDLQKEIEQIKYFIALQKLRFSKDDNIKISFNFNGKHQNILITPMLLLPFVENAFKHGISIKDKSDINISLEFDDRSLLFYVSNTINKNRNSLKPDESGIGLKNVRRRLELLYPDSHELKINQDDDTFNVFLRLEL